MYVCKYLCMYISISVYLNIQLEPHLPGLSSHFPPPLFQPNRCPRQGKASRRAQRPSRGGWPFLASQTPCSAKRPAKNGV